MLYERNINLAEIKPSRWQPREHFDPDTLLELAHSIDDQGLINPVLVFEPDGMSKRYELIAGERRVRAVTATALAALFPQHTLAEWVGRLAEIGLAGLGQEERTALHNEPGAIIRARIHPGEDLQTMHILAVTENLDRADLTPLEEARAYHGLIQEYGWSQRDLAARINKSQGYVAQRLALVGLVPEAQAAMSTRALNITHARAIAALPEPLQPAFTAYAVKETQKSDTPLTTRQVENKARALAAFVDPHRYDLNPEAFYTPRYRNRMRVLRDVMANLDINANGVAEIILGFTDFGQYKTNVLSMKPINLVSDMHYSDVIKTLDQSYRLCVKQSDVWDRYTKAHPEYTCSHCQFGQIPPIHIGALSDLPHCARWSNAIRGKADSIGRYVTTCEGFIGPDDPVIIPTDGYQFRNLCKDLGITIIEEPSPHMVNVEQYAEAVRKAVELASHLDQARDQERRVKHISGIAGYWKFVSTLSNDVRSNFHAHTCEKCRYYMPMNELEDLPPCQLVRNPLTEFWNEDIPRQPQYGILITRTGTIYPRCEAFAYANTPNIWAWPAVDFNGDRERMLRWLDAIGLIATHHLSYMPGVLSWLNYGWDPHDNKRRDKRYNLLNDYLLKNWEELGFDSGIATLIDIAIIENEVLEQHRLDNFRPLLLKSPIAGGKTEEFIGVPFSYLTEKPWHVEGWPADWPRPWEASKTLVEVFAEK